MTLIIIKVSIQCEIQKDCSRTGVHFQSGAEFDGDKVGLSINVSFGVIGPDTSAAGINKNTNNCLDVLQGKGLIYRFKCARVEPKVPVEESIAEHGRVSGVRLCEVNTNTIRKDHASYPISAIEVECSLSSIVLKEDGVGAICAKYREIC